MLHIIVTETQTNHQERSDESLLCKEKAVEKLRRLLNTNITSNKKITISYCNEDSKTERSLLMVKR